MFFLIYIIVFSRTSSYPTIPFKKQNENNVKVGDKHEDYYRAILEHSIAVQSNSGKKILLTARKEVCALWPTKLLEYWYKDSYSWSALCISALDYFSIKPDVPNKSHAASCPYEFCLTAPCLHIHYIALYLLQTLWLSFMCCPFNLLTSKAAAACEGVFCSMREEFVNNNDTLIITNWLLILLWLFYLVIGIGWTCSINVHMCSPSEHTHLYAAFTEVSQKYVLPSSCLGKWTRAFSYHIFAT